MNPISPHISPMSLSCVIPAYNEADNLQQFIPRLSELLQQQTLAYVELIVVNDGSKDQSHQVLEQLLPQFPLKVLHLSRNFGKEAALSAGIDQATGDAVLLIDADFQHPLSAIPTMLELWRSGYDMIYGIRSRNTESWLKRYLTHAFYRVLRLSSSINIPEDAGDFRLMDRKVVTALRQLPEKNRYMKGLYAWVGFNSIGLSFQELDRANGHSRFNFKALFRLAISGITSFSELPLRLSIYAGFGLAFIAILYGLWIIVATLLFGEHVQGWATLAAGVTLLGGIQLMFIGILGEYIGCIYTEVKNRPQYVVAEQQISAQVKSSSSTPSAQQQSNPSDVAGSALSN